ncbi:MAG: RdgB/HAM1 family non-canonical purine NTP pyrophosphatase [Armatimonadota bacterium]|jgi:XTP/dITP diphosphohydrolase
MRKLPASILLATRNAGKVREIRRLLAGLDVELPSLLDIPAEPDVTEPYPTFADNAVHKAAAAARASGMWALADDSGLEIDALDGFPGVASNRFAGPDASDADRNAAILVRLHDMPQEQRTARFVCVVALFVPEGDMATWRGTCEGVIAEAPRGTGGFGFDPLFYVPSQRQTMAEMPLELKNRLSHRAAAFSQACRDLAAGTVTLRRLGAGDVG